LQNPQVAVAIVEGKPVGLAEMCQKMVTIDLRPIGGGGLWLILSNCYHPANGGKRGNARQRNEGEQVAA
jgi:hypothetical protein